MGRKYILALGVVVIVGGGLFWMYRSQPLTSNLPPPTSAVTASLTIDFGDRTEQFKRVVLTTDPTAFGILKTVTEREHIPLVFDPPASMGVFVRQIGKKKNGDDGRYWQYWVNEIFPLVASDRSALEEGDRVEWKFHKEN